MACEIDGQQEGQSAAAMKTNQKHRLRFATSPFALRPLRLGKHTATQPKPPALAFIYLIPIRDEVPIAYRHLKPLGTLRQRNQNVWVSVHSKSLGTLADQTKTSRIDFRPIGTPQVGRRGPPEFPIIRSGKCSWHAPSNSVRWPPPYHLWPACNAKPKLSRHRLLLPNQSGCIVLLVQALQSL